MSHFLVVEDEVVVGLFLREEFADRHVTVDVSTDGAEALERIRTHAYDAAVFDVDVPIVRGDELALQARELHQKLPIVLATGLNREALAASFRDDSLVSVLEKPYEINALIECLEQLGVNVEPSR